MTFHSTLKMVSTLAENILDNEFFITFESSCTILWQMISVTVSLVTGINKSLTQ